MTGHTVAVDGGPTPPYVRVLSASRVVAPGGDLCLSDNLTRFHADEGGRRLWHVLQRVEDALRGSCILFAVEQPERVLNEVTIVDVSRPVTPAGPVMPRTIAMPLLAIIAWVSSS